MIIRPIESQDFASLSKLWNLVFPEDKHSPEELEFYKNSFKEPYKFGQIIASEEASVIGSASYEQNAGMYHPHKFYIRLFVHPEFRGKGIGQKLYDALLQKLEPFEPVSLRVNVKETDTSALHFAQTRKFIETKRDWESVLDLAAFNPEVFKARLEELKTEGYSFKPFAEFDDQEEMGKAFYELFSTVRLDVPRSEPATPFSYDFFKENVLDAPDFYPEGTFFALKGTTLLGLSQLWKGSSSNDLYTGLTAVTREARGKGVATALKVISLETAKQAGAEQVFTNNDTNNVEMLAVNDKLGFKRLPARLSMMKRLREET